MDTSFRGLFAPAAVKSIYRVLQHGLCCGRKNGQAVSIFWHRNYLRVNALTDLEGSRDKVLKGLAWKLR
jgi:hypothetical protein